MSVRQFVDELIKLNEFNIPEGSTREDITFHGFNVLYSKFLLEEGLSLDQIAHDEVTSSVFRKRLIKFFNDLEPWIKDDLPLKYCSQNPSETLTGFLGTMGLWRRSERSKRWLVNKEYLDTYPGFSKNKNQTLTFTYLGQVAVISLIFMVRHTCKGLTARSVLFFPLVQDSLERILTIDIPSLRDQNHIITKEDFYGYQCYRRVHKNWEDQAVSTLSAAIRDVRNGQEQLRVEFGKRRVEIEAFGRDIRVEIEALERSQEAFEAFLLEQRDYLETA